jgi:hypothetical protein
MQFSVPLVAVLAAVLTAGTAAAAPTTGPLHRDRAVTALVAEAQRLLPDAELWDDDQHRTTTVEAVGATGFTIPSQPVVVAGAYIGLQITRQNQTACVLPDPTKVERNWIAVNGGCETYLTRNRAAIAKASSLATVIYPARTIAQRATEYAGSQNRAVKVADLVTMAGTLAQLDFRVKATRTSVTVTSTSKPTATATLTVVRGVVKIRTS